MPSQFVVVACQGKRDGSLRVGVACTYRRPRGQHKAKRTWWRFRSPDQFWRELPKRVESDRPFWLVAHNAPQCWAMLQGFGYLMKRRYYPALVYSRGLTTFIRMQRGRDSIVMLDAGSWWRAGPETMAQWWGLERLGDSRKRVSVHEAETRARREAEIALRSLMAWANLVQTLELGPLRPTIAGQSLAGWRHKHYTHLVTCHAHEEATKMERAALAGGRVEVLKPGKHEAGPYFQVDINSAYLSAMNSHEVPTKLRHIMADVSVDRLRVGVDRFALIAEVAIETDAPRFPKRSEETGNATSYPRGRFWTFLATPELRDALDGGHVLKCRRVAVYDQDYALQDWARWAWGERCNARDRGDDEIASAIKCIGVSLSGKLSQRSKITTEVPNHHNEPDGQYPIVDHHTEEWTEYVIIEGRRFETVETRESLYAFPAIAAHVNSAARSRLWGIMEMIGFDRVYYCDTDCIITDRAGVDSVRHLISRHNLGMMHLDGQSPTLELRAKKDYTFAGQRRIKGVPTDAREVRPGVYVWSSPTTLAESIRGRGKPNAIAARKRDLTASRNQPGLSPFSAPTLSEEV